jgi:NDP-sugar pyrophosphorylase family protein
MTPVADTSLNGMDAVVLAGGQGTRLRSALPDRQKVTADVAGRPFVFNIIEQIKKAGVKRIILALGYRADDVLECLKNAGSPELEILPSIEATPLGTAGALKRASEQIRSSTVLVMNGDSFINADLKGFLSFHRQHRAGISLILTKSEDPRRFGAVCFDKDNKVLAFQEKPDTDQAHFINAGIYLIEKTIIDGIPADQPVSLERDMFPEFCNGALYAMVQDEPLIDIGTPDSWKQADAFFEKLNSGGQNV